MGLLRCTMLEVLYMIVCLIAGTIDDCIAAVCGWDSF